MWGVGPCARDEELRNPDPGGAAAGPADARLRAEPQGYRRHGPLARRAAAGRFDRREGPLRRLCRADRAPAPPRPRTPAGRDRRARAACPRRADAAQPRRTWLRPLRLRGSDTRSHRLQLTAGTPPPRRYIA